MTWYIMARCYLLIGAEIMRIFISALAAGDEKKEHVEVLTDV